jgi:Pirin
VSYFVLRESLVLTILLSTSYYDPRYEKWGNLRVINEDRVDPNEGFGTHAHREFEIFSYIVNGELEQYVLLVLRLDYTNQPTAVTLWATWK